jgi:high-affinity iron transporter
MGTWFSLFNNWETFAGQALAVLVVLGSYFAAQYVRVWRPRKRGLRAATRAERPPAAPRAEQPPADPAAVAAGLPAATMPVAGAPVAGAPVANTL